MIDPGTFIDVDIESNEDIWLAYDRTTGVAHTGRLAADGLVTPLHDFPLDPQWDHVRPLEDGMTLFHRASDQTVSTGRFDSDGRFTDLVTSSLGRFFHHVMTLENGLVLWSVTTYDSDGAMQSLNVVGRVFADGRHEVIGEPFLLDFWTHIVHVGANRILFYNLYSQQAATGVVTGDGGFHDFSRSFSFDHWTLITSVGGGMVLFYNGNTGAFASGRVDAEGGYTDLFSEDLSPGHNFIPTTRGRVAIARTGDVLATHIDGGGVFRDTVVLHGAPLGPGSLVFVR